MSQEVVAKKTDPVAEFINSLSGGWAKVLPNVCTPERFARVAVTCMKKDSKLVEAMQTREGKLSLAEAFMRCAELGIEPDGRRAYLIPYKNNITLIFDYKGIVELAMRSGLISSIHADKVCENDDFEYNIGEIIKHKINFKKERGDAYAYYTVVTFKDGTKKTEVMSKFEVEAIKERSSAWGAYKNTESFALGIPTTTKWRKRPSSNARPNGCRCRPKQRPRLTLTTTMKRIFRLTTSLITERRNKCMPRSKMTTE